MKQELNSDVSQYAKGRLNFWLGTQWNLKDKKFESSGVWNSQLWQLCKRVYPEADIALITYSGDEAAAGINLHRDDSYAAFEARSISIETVPGAETKWQMKQTYPAMGWIEEQDNNASITDFSLPSGSITRFNCKNPHAAFPGAGRWSINLWKVSNKQQDDYKTHIAQNGIDGGAKDFAQQLPPISLPEPIVVTLQTQLTPPPLVKPNALSLAYQQTIELEASRTSKPNISVPPEETKVATSAVKQLNQDQQQAKDGILQWLNDESAGQFATLSGAAGTGKTFLVQQILAEYKEQYPQSSVAFTAPTHSAVRVLEKMSAEAGVKSDFEGTIYKLLGVKPGVDERTGEQTFIQENQKYAGEKIKPDLIVLDEGSMVGKNLYGYLQDALAANTKVLIMGDRAHYVYSTMCNAL